MLEPPAGPSPPAEDHFNRHADLYFLVVWVGELSVDLRDLVE